MKDTTAAGPTAGIALGGVGVERVCLRCKAPFRSEDLSDRICPRCQNAALWRSNLPLGAAQRRRRSPVRAR